MAGREGNEHRLRRFCRWFFCCRGVFCPWRQEQKMGLGDQSCDIPTSTMYLCLLVFILGPHLTARGCGKSLAGVNVGPHFGYRAFEETGGHAWYLSSTLLLYYSEIEMLARASSHLQKSKPQLRQKNRQLQQLAEKTDMALLAQSMGFPLEAGRRFLWHLVLGWRDNKTANTIARVTSQSWWKMCPLFQENPRDSTYCWWCWAIFRSCGSCQSHLWSSAPSTQGMPSRPADNHHCEEWQKTHGLVGAPPATRFPANPVLVLRGDAERFCSSSFDMFDIRWRQRFSVGRPSNRGAFVQSSCLRHFGRLRA